MSLKLAIKSTMEAIDFQDGRFFSELSSALNTLGEVIKLNSDVSIPSVKKGIDVVIKDVEAVIKKYTNLTTIINLKITLAMNAAVMPPWIDMNNPLVIYSNSSDPELLKLVTNLCVKSLRAAVKEVRGGVDLSKGWLTGYYSEYPIDIYINSALFYNLSPEEVGAIVLHEVGHAFSYFEYIGYSYSSNIILTAVLKDFFATDDIKKREMILKTCEEEVNMKIEDPAALAKDPKVDKVILGTVVLKSYNDSFKNSSTPYIYNIKAFEQIADNFAARQGAARPLATALMKIHRSASYLNAYNPMPVYIIRFLLLILDIFATFSIIYIVLITVQIVLFSSPDEQTGIYDTYQGRINNIRRQLVENLKISGLSKEETNRILSDIKAVDIVIENSNNSRGHIEYIMTYMLPWRRVAINQYDYQKMMEEMASNKMYISAAKLKTLTD